MFSRKTGFLISFFLIFHFYYLAAQPFSFAHVTDTHVGGSSGVQDLELTVNDINSQQGIDFVLVTGDITEFGSGEELKEAKRILDRIERPYYVVPGNHDSKWSESGCNDFVRIFGSETFSFEKNGFLFIGTASGPNMRMAPGLVPREQIIFLDSVLSAMKNPDMPVIFANHYPLDESLSNYSKVISLLKTRNIQATLLGHGHANKLYHFSGIPGIMGRSNLRANQKNGGYNLVTIEKDTMYYRERIPGIRTIPTWCKLSLTRNLSSDHPAIMTESGIPVNQGLGPVKIFWEYQENSDIGSAIACSGNICVYSTTSGQVIARKVDSGQILWTHKTGGKIYSTPAIQGNRIVCPSTDGHIYCIHLKNGRLLWDFKTNSPIVASPIIDKNRIFIGSSQGVFRAISLDKGMLIWQYDSVRNFVETRPLLFQKAVFFGSWGNAFYALDRKTGKLLWNREKYNNRMLSPAAVWPVAANGKVFIVAPDRHMSALDAGTGKEIWDSGAYTCRESIGISGDSRIVYIKNMTEGNVDAFLTETETQQLVWECKAGLGYEIAPSPVTEDQNHIFIPTTSGTIYAVDKKSHQVGWKYKFSVALINHVLPIKNNRILVTSMDGKVACLAY